MMHNTQPIVTKALQIAIQVKKDGGTVEQACTEACNTLWEDYNPETQAAAERAINGYFDLNTTPAPVAMNGPTIVPDEFGAVKARLLTSTSADAFTKAELLHFGVVLGVKLAKSATKDRLMSVLKGGLTFSKAA